MMSIENYIVCAISLLLLLPACSLDKRMVNATYSVLTRLGDTDDVVAKDLDDFDFIYLVASPQWKVEDFDMSQEDIDRKYVEEFSYPDPALFEKYIDTVHKNGDKVLCSFPGGEFINIADSPERRMKFARMMAAFVEKYDYDGIELDWELTVTEDLHLAFMQDIRRALDEIGDGKRQYWLTTALNFYRNYTEEQARQLCECTDWINIMFYDMGGGTWGTVASHNSPLDVMKDAIPRYWKYFPNEKLHIGFPSYGYCYKGIVPGEKLPEGRTLADCGRSCSYTELPSMLEQGWTEQWDEVAQCSYFFSPDKSEFMTIETRRSMESKIDWVEESGFGGVFWWEYTSDWIRPESPDKKGVHLLMDYVTDRVK